MDKMKVGYSNKNACKAEKPNLIKGVNFMPEAIFGVLAVVIVVGGVIGIFLFFLICAGLFPYN